MSGLNALKLLPLLSKQVSAITLDDLKLVRDVLGITAEVTPRLMKTVTNFLLKKDITMVAQIMSDTALQEDIKRFFTPQQQAIDDALTIVECAGCHSHSFVNAIRQTGRCPHCGRAVPL